MLNNTFVVSTISQKKKSEEHNFYLNTVASFSSDKTATK